MGRKFLTTRRSFILGGTVEGYVGAPQLLCGWRDTVHHLRAPPLSGTSPVSILKPSPAIPGSGGHCLWPLHTLVPCSLPGNVYSLFKAKLNVTTTGKPPGFPQATFFWTPQPHSTVGTAPRGVICVFTCCSPRLRVSQG